MPFSNYSLDDQGAYVFEGDDGSKLRTAPTPRAYLEAARIDRERQLLAEAGGSSGGPNASPGPSMSGYGGDAAGGNGGAPVALSDAGPPGYSEAPARPPNASVADPAGTGRAHGAPAPPGPDLRSFSPPSAAFVGGSPDRVITPPTPQIQGMGAGDAQPGASLPSEAAAAETASKGGPRIRQGTTIVQTPWDKPPSDWPQPDQAAAGPGKVRFSGPAPGAGGRGGPGGAAPGPKEMLQGRQVTIEGKLSPETKAAQEAVIRRDAALKKREAVRGDERAEYDRENEDRAATIGAAHDLRLKETREAGQKALDDLSTRRADKLKEIEEGKINPNKFWAERSTGHSIAAAIAVGLGAVGNAIAGNNGPNAALGIIDKAIDRDLDAQEKNLDKKKWEAGQLGALYAAEKEHLGDSIAARTEAKIAALTQFSAQAKRLAGMQNLEDRALKADRLALEADARIADLKAKNEDRIKEVQTYKTVMPGGGGGAPKKKSGGGVTLRLSDGKGGYKDKYFPFPPGMSEGQKADFMKRSQGLNNAHRSLDRLEGVLGSGLPIDNNDAQAFAQGYTYEYAEGKGQGQATADQEKSIAAKVTGMRGTKGIAAFRGNLDDTQEEIIRQLTPPEE